PVIEVAEPKVKPVAFVTAVPEDEEAWRDLTVRLLGHFNLADQSLAAHQYDQTVQGGSKIRYIGGRNERMPDELSAKTPLLGKPYVVGVANAVNAFYGEVDPAGLGRMMMAQALTKLVAAGFSPDEVGCNVNLYSPRLPGYPENAWRLVQLVEHGYAPASIELNMPVLSGKDSISGTYVMPDRSVIHAPLICDVLAVGRMPHFQRLIPKAFCQPGDQIVLAHQGLKEIHLGGSVLLDLFGQRGDKLLVLDLADLRRGLLNYHEMLKTAEWSKGVHSRSVVAEGGTFRRLFECCYGGGLGCRIDLPASCDGVLEWLFGELHGAIIMAMPKNDELLGILKEYTVIGEVVAEPTIAVSYHGQRLFSQSVDELTTEWSKTFSEVAA
ncbi:MAG: AIR synthase-related protein, partial [Patescibacteria group bacterium]